MFGLLRSLGSLFAITVLAGFSLFFANQFGLLQDLLPRTATAEAASTPPTAATPAQAPDTPVEGAAPVAAQATPASAALPAARVDRSGPPLQCAIYARQRTGLSLAGAARNWWPAAEGRYQRAHAPSVGSVIVMGGTEAGHVGVVTAVRGPRQIVIDHANWLGQGEIITGALVEDASAANDWSEATVWNVTTNSMGLRRYPVFGFVGPRAA